MYRKRFGEKDVRIYLYIQHLSSNVKLIFFCTYCHSNTEAAGVYVQRWPRRFIRTTRLDDVHLFYAYTYSSKVWLISASIYVISFSGLEVAAATHLHRAVGKRIFFPISSSMAPTSASTFSPSCLAPSLYLPPTTPTL
jgi:hypothetical protein